ncbi:MAG TPA: hypothetical protein VEF33_14240 [Syntrophales bacterium]|nr:hypothetical protein [Syntrophales bacterium]
MTKEDISNNMLILRDKILNEELDQILAELAQKEKVEISLDKKTLATNETPLSIHKYHQEDHKADINGQISML